MRRWTKTALHSRGVRSSVRYSVWVSLGRIYRVDYFGVTMVRMVTIVWINRECELLTCVLRTAFLHIIKSGYVTRNIYAKCHINSCILLSITTYIQGRIQDLEKMGSKVMYEAPKGGCLTFFRHNT